MPLATLLITILPASSVNATSLPGSTPAAVRMCLGDGDLAFIRDLHMPLPDEFNGVGM